MCLCFVFGLMCDVVCFVLFWGCVFVCGLFLFDAFVCVVCDVLCGVVVFFVWVFVFVCLCCMCVCVVLGKLNVYHCVLSVSYGVICCAVCV